MWQNYSIKSSRRRHRFKQAVCYLSIILLLPYILTIFLSGSEIAVNADVKNVYVIVENDGKNIEMSLEEYCIGKLAKEIPIDYEKEALKVQAVLVRTSVYKKIKESGSNVMLEDEFWTIEEMKEQWGAVAFNKNYKKLENVWNATNGQVLLYEEELAVTPFCRLTNGNTRDGKEVLGGEYPYLKIKDCPLDLESTEQFQTVVLKEMDAEIKATDTAGYVTKVSVGKEEVSGEEFRNTYALASSSFVIKNYDGKLRVSSRGVGHGLGLSQYTANEMAKEGDSYKDILNYFFEGTKLQDVAEIVMNK